MTFKNKDEYVAWVKEWKIEHELLVAIQKKLKFFKKKVYHNDVEFTKEELEKFKKIFSSRPALIKAEENKTYGSWEFVYARECLSDILHNEYNERIAGKLYYHKYLNKEAA